MADAGFPRRLVFKGVIEFPLIIEVAGHRIEKQGRLIYEMTPDGLYFDPMNYRHQTQSAF